MAISKDALFETIKDHMDDQPYSCKCVECGSNLDVNAEVDGDLDLKLEIHPCGCKGE